jgi:hypothetical protein
VTSQVNHSFDSPFFAHFSFPGVEQVVPTLAAALLEGEGEALTVFADDFDAFNTDDTRGLEVAAMTLGLL